MMIAAALTLAACVGDDGPPAPLPGYGDGDDEPVDAGEDPVDASADAPDAEADADAAEPPPCTCALHTCEQATCADGGCAYEPMPDGTACPGGGVCMAGVCIKPAGGA